MNKRTIILFLIFTGAALFGRAQDSSRIFFTTSVGIFIPASDFAQAYRNSLALNSGIEYRLGRSWFTQFELDFNAVKYDQQIKDASSPFLFRQTNSSVFLAGLNFGRNVRLSRSGKFFLSPYIGAGYANIGEPRLRDIGNNIFIQDLRRMKGLYIKEGLRIAYRTKSKILQTLYVDASYLSSGISVQDSHPKAFSFVGGTRFGF